MSAHSIPLDPVLGHTTDWNLSVTTRSSFPDITFVELRDPPREVGISRAVCAGNDYPSTNDGAQLEAEACRLLHTFKANRRFSSSETRECDKITEISRTVSRVRKAF
jgi:hypothetical protein